MCHCLYIGFKEKIYRNTDFENLHQRITRTICNMIVSMDSLTSRSQSFQERNIMKGSCCVLNRDMAR